MGIECEGKFGEFGVKVVKFFGEWIVGEGKCYEVKCVYGRRCLKVGVEVEMCGGGVVGFYDEFVVVEIEVMVE